MTDPETTSTIRKVLQGITYSVGAGFLYAGYRRQVELKTLRKAPIVSDNPIDITDADELRGMIKSSPSGRVYIKGSAEINSPTPLENETLPVSSVMNVERITPRTVTATLAPLDVNLEIAPDTGLQVNPGFRLHIAPLETRRLEREIKVLNETSYIHWIFSYILNIPHKEVRTIEYVRNKTKVCVAGDAVLRGKEVYIVEPELSLLNPAAFYLTTQVHSDKEAQLQKLSHIYYALGGAFTTIGLGLTLWARK